jgi:hypothetical protein
MATKEKRYRRLALLHEKLKQVEQARLARLESEASELASEEKRLIEYFSSDALSSLFPDLVMGRIRHNRDEQAETKNALAAQGEKTRGQARRVRQAEVLLEKSVATREKEDVTRSLADILERIGTTKVSAR